MNRFSTLFPLVVVSLGFTARAQVSVSGSPAPGAVPQFTGPSSIGTSSIGVSGNDVGIGTAVPLGRLDVRMDTVWNNTAIVIPETTDQNPKLVFYRPTGTGSLVYPFYIIETDAGLVFAAGPGASPGSEVVSSVTTITSSGNLGIGSSSPSKKLEVNGNIKLGMGTGSHIIFPDGSVQDHAWDGVLESADYAESVDVTGSRNSFEPGDLLVIDPLQDGRFQKADKAYSRLISGVYSTKPGALGRRKPRSVPRDAEVPMAMVGIVPTKVSTENGPVHDGDLLVSSSTPGYAMKGTDRERMMGAVLGKAMGSIESGQGVIEV